RVLTGGRHGHECLGDEALVLVEGSHRGLLPGLVTVEGEDHFPAHGAAGGEHHPGTGAGCVTEQPAHDLDVVGAEGGAAGGHGGAHAGQVHGHHVGVSLDHHHLAV